MLWYRQNIHGNQHFIFKCVFWVVGCRITVEQRAVSYRYYGKATGIIVGSYRIEVESSGKEFWREQVQEVRQNIEARYVLDHLWTV